MNETRSTYTMCQFGRVTDLHLKYMAKDYSLNKDELKLAIDNLSNGTSLLFAISGKMGSGKDTVGDLLIEKLNGKYPKLIDLSFGELIRDEVDYIQSSCQEGGCDELEGVIQELSKKMNVNSVSIEKLMQIVGNENVYQRSDKARKALQFWGDIQRDIDPHYWIKSLGRKITLHLASGYSVNVTDIRFPREVKLIESFPGGKVIRLEVNEETRLERMRNRDDVDTSPEVLNHRTEIALDEHDFEEVFNNEQELSVVTDEVVKYILRGVKADE